MCLALLCQAIQLAISTTLACFILLVLHLFSVICISQAAFYDKNKGFVFWFYWKLWLFLYAHLKKKRDILWEHVQRPEYLSAQ